MANQQIAILADVRPGRHDDLQKMLRQGPPFNLAEHGFTRHHAFLGEANLILVFEGERPTSDVKRLAASLGMAQVTKMARLISNPRLVPEAFSWEASPTTLQPV